MAGGRIRHDCLEALCMWRNVEITLLKPSAANCFGAIVRFGWDGELLPT